ncbi:DUF1775 domain-containing protein [Micromonospora sp. DT47]|uniref:DUF1775 domain-containing protein n=1 Tax=Micromonospora sp. DT47 TaxID=3393431 RepID=UPI003CEA3EDD
MTTTRIGNRRSRTALVLAAAVAGVLGWPGAALAAGVTTTPTRASQGDAVELTLVVPEERPGARTEKIEFKLPADAPIGEVYPLSVNGWAPLITTRTPERPVAGIHGFSVDTVTASVIWTRAGGGDAGPARLAVAMGPLPQADAMRFEVVQTYSDGTVVWWADPAGGGHPAPTLALLPAAPGAATGHGHGATGATADPGTAVGDHAGMAGTGTAPRDAGTPADGDGPSADLLLGGVLLVGLGGGAAIGWVASRGRRRGTPGDPTDDGAAADATPEVAAGEHSAWTFDGRMPGPAGTADGRAGTDATADGTDAAETNATADGTAAAAQPAGSR